MMKYCNKSVIATVYKKQSDDAIERYRFQHLTHKWGGNLISFLLQSRDVIDGCTYILACT